MDSESGMSRDQYNVRSIRHLSLTSASGRSAWFMRLRQSDWIDFVRLWNLGFEPIAHGLRTILVGLISIGVKFRGCGVLSHSMWFISFLLIMTSFLLLVGYRIRRVETKIEQNIDKFPCG
jgi:hypothetical protein